MIRIPPHRNPLQAIGMILFCTLLSLPIALAQSQSIPANKERGLPFVKNYSPKDYGGFGQNFEIIQDQRGFIYSATTDGVLEYDGVKWRKIRLNNAGYARSLAIDKDNRIYVGGLREFGYLSPDQQGKLQYVSLIDQVPEAKRDFTDVWTVHATTHGIYFGTHKYIFRWKNKNQIENHALRGESSDSIDVWSTAIRFRLLSANDHIYVQERGVGLQKMEGDSLVLIKEGAQYDSGTITVFFPMPQKSDQQAIFIGNWRGPLRIYDGKSINDFPTAPELAEYLRVAHIRTGQYLPNGNIALGTAYDVGFVIDQAGRWQQSLSKAKGLKNESIQGICEDKQQALWLATSNGISRVEALSPLSHYTEEQGYKGTPSAAIKHQGVIYLSTVSGIYYLSPSEDPQQVPSFKPVDETNSGWSFVSDGETLLVGSGNGVFRIIGDQLVSLGNETPFTYFLHQSPFDPTLIYLGLADGLGVMKKSLPAKGAGNGQWHYAGRFAGIDQHVRSIVEDSPGNLWLGKAVDGVFRVQVPDSSFDRIDAWSPGADLLTEIPIAVQQFGREHGLPNSVIGVNTIEERVVFTTAQGLKRFDESSQSFVPETTFGDVLSDPSYFVYRIIKGGNGKITSLIVKDHDEPNIRAAIATSSLDTDNTWRVEFNQINRLPSAYINGLKFIYSDPEYPDVIWLGGNNGVFRYDTALEGDYQTDFPAYVRSVVAAGDSTIFMGAANSLGFEWKSPVLVYSLNSFRFEYASPAYDNEDENYYQVMLEGYDKDWSTWSKETQKDYTNLPEGDYQFKVRAQNVYHKISREGVFDFSILPPWYRSNLAYAIYGILALIIIGGFAYLYNRWQTRQLEARNRELEQTVKERTVEVREKNVQLEDTLDHLQTTQQQLIQQEKMASLGQMTAGIAHEIKNPLNFVNNFAEGSVELSDELKEELERYKNSNDPEDYQLLLDLLEDIRENAVLIHDNGQRADNIVSSMMDHANENQGERRPTDLNALLEEYINLAYHGYQAKKENLSVDFQKQFDTNLPRVLLNPQEIGRVLINLFNNAIYAVDQKAQTEKEDYKPTILVSTRLVNKQVEIRIRDNGLGIPVAIREKIFNPFFTTKPTGKGNTGLGLSISYDIVTQGHQGMLNVESEEGSFTEFIILLSLSDA